MKAAIYDRYGPPEVIRLTELPKPEPKPDEILIRTHAATVTAADWRLRSLDLPPGFKLIARLMFGFAGPRKPAVPGMELAGRVEAVGSAVTRFSTGDDVFAFDGRMGCSAQYKCMPETGLVAAKPARLSYGEAAALSFGGSAALSFFRRGRLGSGEKVLVNGASGGVGTACVELAARHFSADVTGVCSAANAGLVEALGARRVIDYEREDFTRAGETYDVIVDTVGTAPFPRCRRALKPGGRLLQIVGGLPDLLKAPWYSMTSGRKVVIAPASTRLEDLKLLAELADAGTFRPFIDRRYPLERIVDAHRYVDSRRKRGNVVIDLIPDA
jgi:NADPH:quinone reductase-like Zn-dependent oxidoreductase